MQKGTFREPKFILTAMNTFLRFSALLLVFSAWGASSVQAQSLYTEDFENETPQNANNLCPSGPPAYSPPDGNWTLGSACPNQVNGRPQLGTNNGNSFFRIKKQYLQNSEVWKSKEFSVAFLSDVIVSLDAASNGDLENSGGAIDQYQIFIELDGVIQSSPIVSQNGHVDGGPNTDRFAQQTFAESVDVSGASTMRVILRVKISSGQGGNNLEAYFLDNVAVCGDDNTDAACDDCDELVFDADLSDQTVQCMSDLPTECNQAVGANRGTVSCALLEERFQKSNYTTSVPDGTGSDWVLILYGEDNNPDDERQFVPTTQGVSLTEYENGTALVTGQVVDVDDPTAILNIQTIFGQGVLGSAWPGSFKSANDCQIPSEGNTTTDSWNIYQMETGLSYLTGEGSLDGSYVQLAHMPGINPGISAPNYGFQVGTGANNRSCELGAGGWFFYSGMLGDEQVENGTGDFSLDLTTNFQTLNPCSEDGESTVTLVYTIQDLACGQVLTEDQVFTRIDNTDPTFDNAPSNVSIDCTDDIPVAPTVTASDNCEDSGFPTVTGPSENTIPGSCPQEYTIVRQWIAEDCSGNQTAHTQNISVEDNTGPTIVGGAPSTVECDGSGNTTELDFWLDSNGGATATDDCGSVTWSHDFTTLSDDCGETGSANVTFTATDDCLNESTITLTFTIQDTTDPTWENSFGFTTAACEDLTDPTDPSQVPFEGASDFCSDVTYSIEAHTFSGGCPNSYQRIWTAIDACGNESAVAEQYVELYDNELPVITLTCPADYTADAAADCTAPVDTATTGAATATASDNCATDLEVDITYSDGPETNACVGQRTFTRTWSASTQDDCDNVGTATCSQVITINDNTAPEVTTMAMDTTAECDGFGNSEEFYAWLANAGGAVATDGCSDVTWSNDYASYQAADAGFSGTYAEGSWTILNDGAPSEVSFSDDGTEIHFDGPLDNQFGPGGGVGVVKACQPARARLSVSFDWAYELNTSWPNTGSLLDPAFYINDTPTTLSGWSWGNTTQNGSMTMVVETGDEFGWGIASFILGGLGNAELTISNFSTEVLASQDPCNEEQRIVTFTASDDCGNTSTSTASFYIEDTTDPEITALMETSVACDLYDAETEYDFSASDICGGTDVDVQISDVPQSGPCAGQISRTYTVTDACGNDAEAMQIITLIDTVKPTITCPGDTTTECGAANMSQLSAWLANVTASDNCDLEVDIDNDYGDENGLSDLCGATGSVTVTWTATDHCDNEQTCSSTFTIQDTTNPEITEEASAETVQCDGSGNTAALSAWLNDNGGAQATDDCGDVTWSYSPNPAAVSDECGETGAVTVTFTATDDCNNTSTTSATFTIEDTIDPEVTTMAMDTTAECDGFGNSAEFYAWLANAGGAVATDGCSDVTWSNDYASYQAADAGFSGTYAEGSWTILNDGAPSEVSFSDDGTEIHFDGPLDNQFGPGGGVGVVKACQPARARLSVSFDWAYELNTSWPNTGSLLDPAFYINDTPTTLSGWSWGNTTQNGSMTMVVETGDEFGWGIASFILGGLGNAELTISNFSTEVLASQDPCNEEQRIVTFTASDDCGNTGVTTTASFYIEDTTDPEITALAETSVACDLYDAETEYDFSASDICGGTDVDVQISDVPQSGPCAGQISRTYTVTDACGNDAEAMQIITLIDTVKPTITCPGDTTTECGAANMSQLSAWLANVTASDNCDLEVDIDNDYGDENGLSDLCGATGSVTVTWTATDHCDNEQTCSSTFTIQDTTNPEITEEASAETVQCDGSGNTAALSAWLNDNGGAQATDDCGDVTWSYSPNPAAVSDECGETGAVTVTFTATDDCNNTSTTSATFTIEDTIDPEVTTMAMDTTAECDGSGNSEEFQAWLANAGGAVATDACSDVTWTNNYDATCDGSAESFLNYKQQDWGKSTSGAASDLLDADFDAVFPEGVKVGCGEGYELVFTSADAVDTYLPCTGGAQDLALSHGGTDPTAESDPSCWDNALVTHVLTAKLNVAFDEADADFSPSDIALGDLIAVQGPFYGMSINEIIAISDQVLGDCSEAYTPQQCRVALRAFNKNYRNGNVDLGFTYIAGCFTDECGQTGSAIVTFTANDDCSNTSTTTTATFTIEDNYGPEITADIEVEVACEDYNDETTYGYSVTDDCSDVTTVISDVMQSGVCGGVYQRTYTATDECGHESTWSQTVTLTDDDAPTFDLHCPQAIINISADALDCSADTTVATHGSATFSNLADNCDTEVDMEVSHVDSQVDGCAGSYVVTRVWTVTATDHCENVTSKTCTQTITVTDDTNPTITIAAVDSTTECDGAGNAQELADWLANNGGATATDACGDVTWSYSPNPAAVSDECGETGAVTVTFTATDECNNTSTTSATFTIQDTTDPSLTIEGPANVDLYVDASCYVDTTVATIGGITYDASDICGSVSVVVTSVDGDISMTCADTDEMLEGSYSFERTFTATATDDCSRTTVETYVQTITVSDTISPQFTNTCGLTNDDDVPVCCTDLSGTVLIPEACDPSADDNCDTEVNIAFTEVYVGDYAPQPGSGVVSYCESSTPEAFEDGEACNGLDSHSFSLFNFDGELRVDFVSDGTGTVAQMEDGTWVLTQDLLASTGGSIGSGGLSLSVTYGEAQSWEDWFVQGQTNYKRDCGDLIDDHENWDYRIMSGGTLTGTGDYSGLSLSLSHAPANEYYAFQVGVGANNQNNNYGYSGWVMASGTYNEENVFFSGDLFGDLDCCLPWSITRDYVASDDCDNSTAFGYTIDVNAESCTEDDGPFVSGGQDGSHGPSVMGGAGDVLTGKSPIRVTNLMPNPTNDLSMLGFTVTQNMRLRVDMFTMDGVLVSQLFDGVASPNVNNTLNIEASDLQSGMYQIRLSSSEYLVVKKLLVTD